MRCKPGILAFIVEVGDDFKDCLGRVVNVLSWDVADQRWIISFEGETPQSIQRMLRRCAPGCPILSYDDCLRPISGLPIEEKATQEECV